MADCLSCDNYVTCDINKIAAKISTGKCKDYVELRAKSAKRRDEPKTCKYCGDKYSGKEKDTCGRCKKNAPLLPRFAKARDDLRELFGLPPLEDNNYD
jgi:hypothetical protein